MNSRKQNKETLLSDWQKNRESDSSEQKTLNKFSLTSQWIFWILFVVAVAVIGFSGFYFYQYYNSSGVEINLEGPSEVLAGVPFDVKIKVQNNSNKAVKDTNFSMILPENSVFLTENQENPGVLNRTIGNLDQGEIYQNSVSIVVFGTHETVRKFEATVSYYPPSLGPRARFEKTGTVNISIREPAIKIDLSTPQKVLNNEDFSITATYQNVSEIDFVKTKFKIDYPSSFTFDKSEPVPTLGNNIWEIKNLKKNSQNETIVVQGKILGPENSFFEIKISAFVELFGKEYLVNEKSANLNIAQSPLSLTISVNGRNDYVAFLNENLQYRAVYQNNSDTGLNDVVIKLQLSGEMFDVQTLSTKGFFNSQTNIVTWNAANTPELRIISPGSSGQIDFTVRTKNNYPIKRVSDKNFLLKINGEISSPTVPYYVASDKTIGLTEFETKVGGKVEIDSQAFFRDSASGVFNAGSLPPKVNQPTNFTIHWIITNYSTDIKNIEIKSFLQSGIRWIKAVKSNISSIPSYNENTQEISWFIDQIPATKGVVNSPIEAVFQIEATPDITQVGNSMPLLSQTLLTALDQFVNVQLTASDKELDTRLPDDPTVSQNQTMVIQ